ncbi:transcription initiation factor TFIID subunit 9-like [Branchiostoma lanceolatum]|uniref:TAF9B protein n=2 Tax=Branchiostoma lanceolatum TaxID=7740 RepID=A0A8K0ESY9_BRALA|nr:TAF9B [Branchiostoma lanceolatum]
MPEKMTAPKDAQVMAAVLKDMGVTDYEPRVINQMLEFTYRYVTDIFENARVYSTFAKKKEMDTSDVKLAIRHNSDHSFATPPPRDFLMEIARQKNSTPLPLIKPYGGPRLPPDRYCLLSNNYRLRALHKKPKLTVAVPRLGLSSVMGQHSPVGTSTSRVSSPTTAKITIPVSVTSRVGQHSSHIKTSQATLLQPTSLLGRPMSTLGSSTSIGDASGIKRKREDDDYDLLE